ncbi:hypothetical protein QZH41_004642 [Actinostola sp. cb2023]|nr:hypothetical protein QZH41_004642 [Actinostola sp. cb2023]
MKPKRTTRRNAFTLGDTITLHEEVKEDLSLPDGQSMEVIDVAEKKPKTNSANGSLSEDLVNAFKEVFDLFDSNGGGTIDAEELDLALRSVDIQLSQDEIIEVLTSMDKDGNGEIDFEEFLSLMTNTERFLEGLDQPARSTSFKIGRETMLFEALTNFMKRSALHSLNEIVGFYHTKYKRIQAPHVVGHYAAGARLIGLTEFQLRKHMETLKARHAAGDENSPYAEPLHIVFGSVAKKKRKKQKPQPKKPGDTPICRGKIRLRFQNSVMEHPPMAKKNSIPLFSPLPGPMRLLPGRRNTGAPRKTALNYYNCSGWQAQRIQPFPVELPISSVKTSDVPGKLNARILSFDYLPVIRDKVGKAKRHYFERLHDRKLKESQKHWQALKSESIKSDALRNKFRIAFNAYTNFLHIDESRTRRIAHSFSQRNSANSFDFRDVERGEVLRALEAINPHKATGHDNLPPSVLKLVADEIATSLTSIFNQVIHDNTWPKHWKMGEWIPVHKKDDPQDKTNYRPITILAAVDKIFEQLLCQQLNAKFEHTFDSFMSAYRKHYSCKKTLVRLVDDRKKGMHDGCTSAAILSTDMSKAFDSLHPTLLLAKLKAYGLSQSALNLMSSYFSGRENKNKIGPHYK